jgi:hypothetical protein
MHATYRKLAGPGSPLPAAPGFGAVSHHPERFARRQHDEAVEFPEEFSPVLVRIRQELIDDLARHQDLGEEPSKDRNVADAGQSEDGARVADDRPTEQIRHA